MCLRSLALAAACCLSLFGCKAHPSFRSVTSLPHKDALHLVVLLGERQERAAYQDIAVAELSRQNLHGLRQRHAVESAPVPLYQAAVEFYAAQAPMERLARIIFLFPHGSVELPLSAAELQRKIATGQVSVETTIF